MSVFNSQTLRSLRWVFALIFSLSLFYSFYANLEASLDPSVPTKDHLSSDLKGDSLILDNAIHGIPDKVWHSAKDGNLSEKQQQWTSSWIRKNPFHRQEVLTDRSSEAFVRAHYKTRPDIIEIYEAIPIPILRADFLRYLIVLAGGGIWSDLDVVCEKAMKDWIPEEYKDQSQNIDMIVGLEFDSEWHGPGTQVASQFCNWVFLVQPSSRNLQVVVDSVIAKLKEIAHTNSVPIRGIILDMLPDVVDVTGPKIMTVALLKGLEQLLGRPVDDRDFSGIKQPKLVGDLLILPGNSFAASQNGYRTDQGDPLVTHNYEGSWKQADAEAKERKKHNKDQKQ